MFCNLPQGQLAALMLIKSMEAMAAAGTSPFAKKFMILVKNQEWDALAAIASMSSDAEVTPSAKDFKAVGTMSAGLQNAYFFLALVDLSKDKAAKAKFKDALDTHCWDQIAEAINKDLPDPSTHFSGADLHKAYAPKETGKCKGTSPIAEAIAGLTKAGELVGSFFSKSLPDFFENDLANFFTDTVGEAFAGPFADFFGDLGKGIADDFGSFANNFADALDALGSLPDVFETTANEIKDVGEDAAHALDPRNW